MVVLSRYRQEASPTAAGRWQFSEGHDDFISWTMAGLAIPKQLETITRYKIPDADVNTCDNV
jgi:hypothetical protein